MDHEDTSASHNIPTSLDRCLVRLDYLSTIKDGWYGVGSRAIDHRALQMAKDFLPQWFNQAELIADHLAIFPTPEGYVAIEFQKNGWDLTILLGVEAAPALATALDNPPGEQADGDARAPFVEFYGIQLGGPAELDPIRVAPAELLTAIREFLDIAPQILENASVQG